MSIAGVSEEISKKLLEAPHDVTVSICAFPAAANLCAMQNNPPRFITELDKFCAEANITVFPAIVLASQMRLHFSDDTALVMRNVQRVAGYGGSYFIANHVHAIYRTLRLLSSHADKDYSNCDAACAYMTDYPIENLVEPTPGASRVQLIVTPAPTIEKAMRGITWNRFVKIITGMEDLMSYINGDMLTPYVLPSMVEFLTRTADLLTLDAFPEISVSGARNTIFRTLAIRDPNAANPIYNVEAPNLPVIGQDIRTLMAAIQNRTFNIPGHVNEGLVFSHVLDTERYIATTSNYYIPELNVNFDGTNLDRAVMDHRRMNGILLGSQSELLSNYLREFGQRFIGLGAHIRQVVYIAAVQMIGTSIAIGTGMNHKDSANRTNMMTADARDMTDFVTAALAHIRQGSGIDIADDAALLRALSEDYSGFSLVNSAVGNFLREGHHNVNAARFHKNVANAITSISDRFGHLKLAFNRGLRETITAVNDPWFEHFSVTVHRTFAHDMKTFNVARIFYNSDARQAIDYPFTGYDKVGFQSAPSGLAIYTAAHAILNDIAGHGGKRVNKLKNSFITFHNLAENVDSLDRFKYSDCSQVLRGAPKEALPEVNAEALAWAGSYVKFAQEEVNRENNKWLSDHVYLAKSLVNKASGAKIASIKEVFETRGQFIGEGLNAYLKTSRGQETAAKYHEKNLEDIIGGDDVED